MQFNLDLEQAKELDKQDSLKGYKERFSFPQHKGQNSLYFTGHSLGAMPKNLPNVVEEEFSSWSSYGVEAHFKGEHPWLPYHEYLTESFANLVGAKPCEVVAMNTLTTNLHLMLVSFYRPMGKRTKILIENNTFPSDRYAALSQARFHGLDPESTVIELRPDEGKITVSEESILKQIEEIGDELALVLLGNCNYLSGQYFPIPEITKKAHDLGAFCGYNLAHGAGNIELDLHKDNVDFAVWCSYKYLNSGPGGIAGAFVHQKHHDNPNVPRFEGWWGTSKEKRFKMKPEFEPIPTVEAWQLSNPPIFQLAAARASMLLFDEIGIKELRKKSRHINAYLDFLITQKLSDRIQVVTPKSRGTMLCLKVKDGAKNLEAEFSKEGAYVDFREPDIIRIAPCPLYVSYEDCFKLVELFDKYL